MWSFFNALNKSHIKSTNWRLPQSSFALKILTFTCQMLRPRWHQGSWMLCSTGPSRPPCLSYSNSCPFFSWTWSASFRLSLNYVCASGTPSRTDANYALWRKWDIPQPPIADWQDATWRAALSAAHHEDEIGTKPQDWRCLRLRAACPICLPKVYLFTLNMFVMLL